MHKHLDGIRSQLSRTPPCRTGWKALVKETVDYFLLGAKKTSKASAAGPKPAAGKAAKPKAAAAAPPKAADAEIAESLEHSEGGEDAD